MEIYGGRLIGMKQEKVEKKGEMPERCNAWKSKKQGKRIM